MLGRSTKIRDHLVVTRLRKAPITTSPSTALRPPTDRNATTPVDVVAAQRDAPETQKRPYSPVHPQDTMHAAPRLGASRECSQFFSQSPPTHKNGTIPQCTHKRLCTPLSIYRHVDMWVYRLNRWVYMGLRVGPLRLGVFDRCSMEVPFLLQILLYEADWLYTYIHTYIQEIRE